MINNPHRHTNPLEENSIRPITDNEFVLFQAIIRKVSGIYLSPAKKALLVARLSRRLRDLGFTSFGAYYRSLIKEGGLEELARMLDCVCTNETSFFREPRQFKFIEERMIPELKSAVTRRLRSRQVKVWSAACSTGEEPYSLAMVLHHHLPPTTGWEIDILATDISSRVLSAAQEGIWPLDQASQIPPAYLKEYMLRGTRSQEGKMKAGQVIRQQVRFGRINLNDDTYPLSGTFDAIFCRNVLMYFDAESKARVIEKLLARLSPTGYLFLGHAESLNGFGGRVRSVGPTVYTPVWEQAA